MKGHHHAMPLDPLPLLDPLELTVLTLVASLIVMIVIIVIVSTSTDAKMAPEQFEPLIKSPRLQWALVAALLCLNVALWIKVGMRWLTND